MRFSPHIDSHCSFISCDTLRVALLYSLVPFLVEEWPVLTQLALEHWNGEKRKTQTNTYPHTWAFNYRRHTLFMLAYTSFWDSPLCTTCTVTELHTLGMQIYNQHTHKHFCLHFTFLVFSLLLKFSEFIFTPLASLTAVQKMDNSAIKWTN